MEKMKKIKNYLLAFIIPFVMCIAIFYSKGILQNIEDICVSDLRLQHIVFLNYLKEVLKGDASILYSFYAGMGSSMLSTIIFYCVSPINLLLLVVEDIRYAVLFIYFIKVGLAGLTMFILLKNKVDKNNFSTVLFSTCYAVGAFAINYFFCGFWFDVLYLAPLVTLGIDRMVKKEKISLLYIFSLALAIICNIQMGFGLCVYSVVYYIYSYSINYEIKNNFKKFKQLGIIFAISSLCAGAISSGALLGFAGDYDQISSARELTITTVTGVSNLGYILKNLFTVGNLKADYYNNYEPFIYSGLIVSFFSILYLFNTDIDKKKRRGAMGVILVFIISFCVEFINLFWHLSSPVLLNYRYSIYLALFLTMIAYECYSTKTKLLKKDLILLSVTLLIGFFMIIAYATETYVIYTFVFLALIFALIILTKNKSKKFEILLSILVIVEIFMNGYLSIYTANQLPYGKYSSYESLIELNSKNTFDDNYRVMYNYSYTDNTNDTLLLNNNSSLRYFSSVINGDVLKFFNRNLSHVGNNNYMISAYDSPLLVSLFGNKYFYLTDEFNNSIYKKIDSYKLDDYNYVTASHETKDVYLYENPYALSLGYVIESDVIYDEKIDLVDYQNKIIKAFTGKDDDVLIRLDYTDVPDSEFCSDSTFYSCKTYEIINDTNNVLVYVFTLFDQYRIENNSKNYLDTNRPLLISTIDNRITVSLNYNGDLDKEEFVVMTYDESSLIDNLSFLQKDMLENIKIKDNVMTAEIDSSKDGILFLTIPYDDNFKIYVDNKEVSYYSVLNNSFVGLDIEEGKHDIKVEYVDGKFKWYIVATISSIVVTLVLYYFINKSVEKRQEKERFEQEQLKEKKAKLAQKKKNKKRK